MAFSRLARDRRLSQDGRRQDLRYQDARRTNSSEMSDPLPGLPAAPFDTRSEFQEHILNGVTMAQREILMADLDFQIWPLNSPDLETSLRGFFLASRVNRLRLLAGPGHRIARQAPRLMRVLTQFSHAFTCRTPPDHLMQRFSNDISLLVVDRARLVRRFHQDRPRGTVEFDPDEAHLWTDLFEAIWDESSPGLSATTLGLSV